MSENFLSRKWTASILQISATPLLIYGCVLGMPTASAELLKPEVQIPVTMKNAERKAHTDHMSQSPRGGQYHATQCPEIFYNAIRSEAMITALTCSQRNLYTQAVNSSVYRSSAISKHFRSERAHLNYTTDLANQQSLYDIRHYGEGLCSKRATLLHDMTISIAKPDRYVIENDIFVSAKKDICALR